MGFHLANRLLEDGHEVHGFDGMTPYYDPSLKKARVRILEEQGRFSWTEGMLEDKMALEASLEDRVPDVIIHLAAQAGVRYSLEAPLAYVDANLVGTFNILELARELKPAHLMLASTSSVYGGNQKLPFAESDGSHFPMSLYAATKKATEAMSHAYAHLFDIPTTCFRFFTVYGPWGRPDMALFKFVERIEAGEAIDVYGNGEMSRDFTFVDDLVAAIEMLSLKAPVVGEPVVAPGAVDSLSPVAPWRVVNIAGGREVPLLEYIEAIERHLGQPAKKNFLPMQPGT
ncbi:NAD-dependent epimerase/dehydratase family protein [Microbacterium sp. JZ37]|uniref:NAD-dependent epimerase/dehydratase family protein n=1 Tax=Microbacterium sp. JZ37 TaxID=2654193 RepID=UPI002B47945D|nr:NAD-dependent epimerase/dehydratase family protein [Microbacterium sp. JZ37]